MNIKHFLDDIRSNCTQITYLCAEHILEKQFNIEKDKLHEDDIMNLFANYGNFQKYLNDYAGVIYRRHMSSVEEVYAELCNHLNLDDNNQYMFEFDLEKLEKVSPAKLMQIEDDDLKFLTIEKQESRLQRLMESRSYLENIESYGDRVEKVKGNLALVKKALKLSDDY